MSIGSEEKCAAPPQTIGLGRPPETRFTLSNWLTFSELAVNADAFDTLVGATPDIDHFCSSSAWALPAQKVFSPDADPWIYAADGTVIALMAMPMGEGRIEAMPLESGWGLAAPFAGQVPERAAELLYEMWSTSPIKLDAIHLSGLRLRGVWMEAVARRFHSTHYLGVWGGCERRIAQLNGGPDAFLARRSAKFRATLRRAVRRADTAGVQYDYITGGDADALYDRIQAIETHGWKSAEGAGIDEGLTRAFYAEIIERLLERDAFRGLFVRLGGEDIAYVFGGLWRTLYRGLQLSHRIDAAELSPGNLAQWALIQHLMAEGVTVYDMGTDMPYKRRWAELEFKTVSLSLFPRDGDVYPFAVDEGA